MKLRDESKIFNRLKSDFELLTNQGYGVVGVFLQGSQNYNLDYEGSDIDTKAILLPSFEDFLLNKKLISTTLELPPSNEHLDIKDIRLMFDNFKKQNINFIEILFTKYNHINPKYAELFQPMFDIKERIARYDQYKTLNAIAGMSMEKFKAMEHPYPTLVDKIKKFGFDGKQVSHIERLNDFIIKYVQGKPYSECLIVDEEKIQHLIDVKTNSTYTLEEARCVAKSYCDLNYEISKKWQSENEKIIDAEVDEIMTKVLIDIFRLRFSSELTGGNYETNE
jgi:predicted nucleotidyltransferase